MNSDVLVEETVRVRLFSVQQCCYDSVRVIGLSQQNVLVQNESFSKYKSYYALDNLILFNLCIMW
jgi:hypothetical protein